MQYASENNIPFVCLDEKNEYKITFNADNGSETYTKSVAEGETLNYVPQTPTKKGYTFVGWYKDTDDINTAYKSGQTYTQDITYKAKYAHVTMLGAQGKMIVNGKSGIRFRTKLFTDGDKIIQKGTLVLPINLLEEGTSLTLDTPKAVKSVATVNYEQTTDSITYLGTIVNIPESQFGRKMTAAAYIIYQDKSGNQYTVYAPYQNSSYK